MNLCLIKVRLKKAELKFKIFDLYLKILIFFTNSIIYYYIYQILLILWIFTTTHTKTILFHNQTKKYQKYANLHQL